MTKNELGRWESLTDLNGSAGVVLMSERLGTESQISERGLVRQSGTGSNPLTWTRRGTRINKASNGRLTRRGANNPLSVAQLDTVTKDNEHKNQTRPGKPPSKPLQSSL